MLGTLLSVVTAGFLIGALARLAVPGPDPMPLSLTLLIGFAGSIVGGAIAAAIYGARHTFDTSGSVFVTVMLEVGVATLIVVAYRRFVQGRPLSGPEARRFPSSGIGIAKMRERLRQLGVDPDRLGQPGRGRARPAPTADDVAEERERLRDRHAKGELTDEEYEQARERLRRY